MTFLTEGITLALKLLYSPLRVESGIIGAHVRAKELFAKMPHMTQVFGVGKVCTSDVSYPVVQKYFCRFIDSHADGRVAPDSPCDAMSIGIAIKTSIVQAGPVMPDQPAFKECPPEVNPGNDSCDVPAPGGTQ